ncbi:hypothetical protein BS47DRAFT_1337078 [Hydnum rufescens UP504]|uniref:Hemerythrin n=1 Tax=Hydnum rufescens UP504 TaxID=1448309 RepID=A0A9P6E1I1_9AGAM|nr:hypothetical protein BS47DRAFT_1337078 [Hydnum rufescens UP504]
MISHHHHWEETKYYPMFRAEFNSASIVAEHKLFHDGIAKVENYLTSCLTIGDTWGYGQVVTASRKRLAVDPIAFDGRHLRDIIDTFVVALLQHLQNEITYLRPEAIRGSGMNAAEMASINDATTKHFAGQPKTTLHVYAVLHTPPTSDFPPTPPLLKSFFVPYVLYGFHRQWWQFAPRRK